MVPELISCDEKSGKSCNKDKDKSFRGAMKVLKKLKGRMGIGSHGGDSSSQPLLQFHSVHGEYVQLSADRNLARRIDSFCKGIAFSQRPIRPYEKVYLRIAETSTCWNGVLRLGLSSVNPSAINGVLPKYACPDLTSRPGFWGKALPERYVDSGVVLCFHVTSGGDVMLSVDGTEKGVFLSGVDTRSPLWVMLDIYGNSIAVQFVDPRGTLNNNPRRNLSVQRSTTSLPATGEANHSQTLLRRRSEADLLVSMNALNLSQSQQTLHSRSDTPPTVIQNFPAPPPVRGYRNVTFNSLTLFPRAHGKNIRLSPDCRIAVRNESEFCNGYVFSSRPMSPGETLVIQIVQTESLYVGGFALGFTTCNPASLTQTNLPDDADLLLDRPEYWVISKDVARSPATGDEIEFHLSTNGEVTMSRNRGPAVLLMHVDVSLPLWSVFDVYGNTRAIRVLGTVAEAARPLSVIVNSPAPSLSAAGPASSASPHGVPHNSAGLLATSATPVLSSGPSSYVETLSHFGMAATAAGDMNGECTICYERNVDCVLYTCGHMCLCYVCALQLYRGGRQGQSQGLCPICRAPIRDVIRAYRS
nr:EOG090X03H5 [Eulimnadia texana]